ncbi:MAG: biotin synthase BioB [bacterium]
MNLDKIYEKASSNIVLSEAESMYLIDTKDEDTFTLLSYAEKLRYQYKSNKIHLCSIINAKSGKCSENCSFCAQSAHHNAKETPIYPLNSSDEMISYAKECEDNMKTTCFSVVTSGKGINKAEELNEIAATLSHIKKTTNMNRCVSLGVLDRESIKALKDAGLSRLHHNLETAESYFPNICTTHTYQDRLNTLKLAKEAGLQVCSGGIFGLGESLEQRVELGMLLRELEVNSVPINILNPIPGTPLEKQPIMKPLEALRLVATYRFMLPYADIGIFGGRELALGSLQPLMFIAGANQTLIGNYLITEGQTPEKDLQMIKDLGLEVG